MTNVKEWLMPAFTLGFALGLLAIAAVLLSGEPERPSRNQASGLFGIQVLSLS